MRPTTLGVLLLLLLAPGLAAAQHARGRVVDAEAGRPTAGALVTLVAGAERLAPALTAEDGTYLAAAPAPGTYRVRVDLIGYETWLSAPVTLGAADTAVVDVRLPLRRVELAAVKVEDASRCEARPQEVPRLLGLWEEVRRALTISDLSARRGLVPIDLTVTRQQRIGRWVSSRSVEYTRAAGAQPWRARPPSELAARGYVRRDGDAYEYLGPDVPILLSREFVETHCFRAVRRRGVRGADVGLAFEPVRGRTLPDVAGTIWLDEGSSRLERVDFEFVNLPDSVLALGKSHGSLEFARQPGGAWYVRKWRISRDAEGARAASHDALGEASPVKRNARGAAATLVGTVVDSTVGEGLEGVTVYVPGAEPVRTDSLGRFTVPIHDLPDRYRDYVVSFEHPRLAVLGLGGMQHRARLIAGTTTTLDAAIPSTATLVTALCLGDGGALDGSAPHAVGIVIGRATREDGSALAAGARVVAEWPSDEALGAGTAERLQQRSAVVGEGGRFRLCPVPMRRTIRLYMEEGMGKGPVLELRGARHGHRRDRG